MDPWSKQCQIAEDLVNHGRVSVVSCNNAGKSMLAAWCLIYFQSCYKDSISQLVGPTSWQVWNITWRKVRDGFAKSLRPLPGKMLVKKWEIGPQWYATGLSTDTEEQFQGVHATSAESPLFVVVDEASGVAPYVFDAIRGWLTTEHCYVLLIGNGNKSEGGFFETHARADSPWIKHQISAFDVPPRVLRPEWIEEQRKWYGENSPQWEVRVLGKFPAKGADWQLIPEYLLEQAEAAEPKNREEGVHMGVDVSRAGNDNNVAVLTRDGVIDDFDFWQSNDTMVTAERVANLKDRWDVPMGNLHIEEDGIGGAVVDRLREGGVIVDAVQSGGEATGEHIAYTGDMKFGYRKAELAFAARHMLMRGAACIPKHFDQFWKDVQRINYEMDSKGRTVLESKKKLRARTGTSPDFADAWFVSFSRQGNMGLLWF